MDFPVFLTFTNPLLQSNIRTEQYVYVRVFFSHFCVIYKDFFAQSQIEICANTPPPLSSSADGTSASQEGDPCACKHPSLVRPREESNERQSRRGARSLLSHL